MHMRDNIYVGSLISERALEHSSGPWKKHKYLKKIGDKYVYAKSELASAMVRTKDKLAETVQNAKDIHETFKDASETRKEQRELTKGERGFRARENAKFYQEEANKKETYASRSDTSATNRKEAKDSAVEYRKEAQRLRGNYNKTALGKAENAASKLKNKVTYKERRASHARIDNTIARQYGDSTKARLSAARQSELERNSIKQRSERAKKRVMKALGRFKKRK